MEAIIKTVLEALPKAGFVEVEVSARHVHLSAKDVEALFGPGAELIPEAAFVPARPVPVRAARHSDRPQGPQGAHRRSGTGPQGHSGGAVQERLWSWASRRPSRESGDVAGSGSITIEGPKGTITIPEGVMIAHNHVHLVPETAAVMGVHDKQRVTVEVMTERPVAFRTSSSASARLQPTGCTSTLTRPTPRRCPALPGPYPK